MADVPVPIGPRMLIYRCMNVSCRVETFKGAPAVPILNCPVCLLPGAVIQ